jgi:hypothetical protein
MQKLNERYRTLLAKALLTLGYSCEYQYFFRSKDKTIAL